MGLWYLETGLTISKPQKRAQGVGRQNVFILNDEYSVGFND